VSIVLNLAIGGMPMSSVGFGYRWDACELYRFCYRSDSCEVMALSYSRVT
jgi:hypothetical protein